MTVSVDLELQEITQIEQVLMRHKRTPVILTLQEKMREARVALLKERERRP